MRVIKYSLPAVITIALAGKIFKGVFTKSDSNDQDSSLKNELTS